MDAHHHPPRQPDFFIDTKGYCFLCLSETVPPMSSSGSGSSQSTVYSFQHISHYLGMSRRAAFSEKMAIPPSLLRKVERSKLKVELCPGCGSQAGKFTRLFQQLERIQMELNTCLETIHGKMKKAEGLGRVKNFGGLGRLREGKDEEKINIAQRVREEALLKCRRKLRKSTPRVKLPRIRRPTKVGKEIGPARPSSTKLKQESHGVSIKRESKSSLEQLDLGEIIAVALEQGLPGPEPITNPLFTSIPASQLDFQSFQFHASAPSHVDVDGLRQAQIQLPPGAAAASDNGTSSYQLLIVEPAPAPAPPEVTNSTSSISRSRESRPPSSSSSSLKRFYCNLCGSSFGSDKNRKRHFDSIHLNLRYPCDLCPKSYTQQGQLKRHKDRDHFGISQNYQCNRCKQTFDEWKKVHLHRKSSPECSGFKYTRLQASGAEVEGAQGEEEEVGMIDDESESEVMVLLDRTDTDTDPSMDPLSGDGDEDGDDSFLPEAEMFENELIMQMML